MDRLIVAEALTAKICAKMELQIPMILPCDPTLKYGLRKVLAFINFRNVNCLHGDRQPDIITINSDLLEFLSNGALKFLLAHELAHCVIGLFNGNKCDALAAKFVGKENGYKLFKELELFCVAMKTGHKRSMWSDRIKSLKKVRI